ncbi:MAG: hypothetical protein MJ212_01820 [Alphaproteobacteria bacterium]|nr:hypothetical protein [Alphaproteobacteria bacterium]
MTKSNQNKFSFGWKHAVAIIAFSMCFGAYSGCKSYKQEQEEKQKKEILERKKKLEKKVTPIENPLHDVVYKVDTIKCKTRAVMYHTAGKIIRNYVPNADTYRMKMMYFVHEQWHLHNYQLRYATKYLYKPEEYFKLCMHEEISANIAQLLTTRYEYLAAKDKKQVVDRYKKGVFAFYYNAIQKNEINPLDNSPEARKKEWTLIANGTRKMWMDKFYSHYQPSLIKHFQTYLQRFGLVESNGRAYNYVRNYMYTIGGVNFAECMSEDVPVNDNKVNLAQKLSEISSLRQYGKPLFEKVLKDIHLLDSVDIKKRPECFQHILIAEQLKLKLQDFRPEYLEENPQVVQKYYDIVTRDVYTDLSFAKVVSEYNYCTIPISQSVDMDNRYEDVLQKIYTLDGRDLRTQLKKYDEHNVPFQLGTDFIFKTRQDLLQVYMLGIFPNVTIDEVKDAFACKSETKSDVVPYSGNKSAPRTSDEMRVEVPNFWKPILTDNSKEVIDKISECLQKFDEIAKADNERIMNEYRSQQIQNGR